MSHGGSTMSSSNQAGAAAAAAMEACDASGAAFVALQLRVCTRLTVGMALTCPCLDDACGQAMAVPAAAVDAWV